MARDIDDQLTKYLTDAHAMEVQALAQMRSAPDMAGDALLSAAFSAHLRETERHEQLIRERLDARDASPSKLEDLLGAISGKGFVLFAKSQPDTPGKLAAHAYAYEHLELAAYDLLGRVAREAGDAETAAVAHAIGEEEAAMGRRLEAAFDATAAASLAAGRTHDPGSALDDYLADAHALEQQAIVLLEKAREIGGEPQLERAYAEHLRETRAHAEALEQRLAARGAGRSRLKDAAMRLGALNWGLFLRAQPETPGKLVAFAYAFEHLEIAGYEQLRRVAETAGDGAAVALAQRILREERAAAATIATRFDAAVDASLALVGIAD
jgi:ferritin-like metal-binding protein YciE